MTDLSLSNDFSLGVVGSNDSYVPFSEFLIRTCADLLPSDNRETFRSMGLLSQACFLYKTYIGKCLEGRLKSLSICGEMDSCDQTSYEEASVYYELERTARRSMVLDSHFKGGHDVHTLSL